MRTITYDPTAPVDGLYAAACLVDVPDGTGSSTPQDLLMLVSRSLLEGMLAHRRILKDPWAYSVEQVLKPHAPPVGIPDDSVQDLIGLSGFTAFWDDGNPFDGVSVCDDEPDFWALYSTRHGFSLRGTFQKDEPVTVGYTDLMVDGAPSPHQSDTTLRWLIDRLRS